LGRSGYTSLSIKEDDYNEIRKKYDALYEGKLTFTVWSQNVIEASFDRLKLLRKMFPDFTVLTITDNGLAIQNKKKNEIVQVELKNNKITCTGSTKDAQSYILFAALHPEFV